MNNAPAERSPYLKPAQDNHKSAERLTSVPSGVEADSPKVPNLPAVRKLYAVIDNVTDQLTGGIQLHVNEQAAIRSFMQVAMAKGNLINSNPRDFDLWSLGSLSVDHRLTPDKQMVLSGTQIATAIGETSHPSV